jgi:hypothetical protein
MTLSITRARGPEEMLHDLQRFRMPDENQPSYFIGVGHGGTNVALQVNFEDGWGANVLEWDQYQHVLERPEWAALCRTYIDMYELYFGRKIEVHPLPWEVEP